MKKEINDALNAVGLTDFQVVLYITLLKNPLSSVLEISKKLGKNRQQIYNDAEILVSKGVLEKTSKTKRKYIASSPSKILELAKVRQNEAEECYKKILEITPELQKLVGNYKTEIYTKFYEGEIQMKEAYERELSISKNAEVFSLVGEIEEVFEMFSEEYWDKWNRKFVKNCGSSKMIVNNSRTAKSSALNDQKYNRKTKYIDDFKLKINIDVFDRHVLLVSFKDKFAIWIESEIVANSYKILFETLWNVAKS